MTKRIVLFSTAIAFLFVIGALFFLRTIIIKESIAIEKAQQTQTEALELITEFQGLERDVEQLFAVVMTAKIDTAKASKQQVDSTFRSFKTKIDSLQNRHFSVDTIKSLKDVVVQRAVATYEVMSGVVHDTITIPKRMFLDELAKASRGLITATEKIETKELPEMLKESMAVTKRALALKNRIDTLGWSIIGITVCTFVFVMWNLNKNLSSHVKSTESTTSTTE